MARPTDWDSKKLVQLNMDAHALMDSGEATGWNHAARLLACTDKWRDYSAATLKRRIHSLPSFIK